MMTNQWRENMTTKTQTATTFRAGTRKQKMFERFMSGGDKVAKLYGARAGLSPNTMASWMTAFRKVQKKSKRARK
jgi:hypothetical protein